MYTKKKIDTYLDERKKNLEKIKQKRRNYESEQQSIYACEKEREKRRKLLYTWLTFKHSVKCLLRFGK